jgi:hypothetical protein
MAGIQRKIPHVETTNARGEIPLFMKHQAAERVVSGAGTSGRENVRFLGRWKNLGAL